MRQVLAAALAALAVAASPAAAQRGIAVEVRGGAGVGNHAPAGTDFELEPHPSFGATVAYAVRPAVEVYAGYSRTEFGCEGGFCSGQGMTFTSSGVEAGARLSLPVAASPWLRLGIVGHTLDYAASDGAEPRAGESTSGVGFELGGGVEARLRGRLSLTPGVRYVRYGSAGDDAVAMVVGDIGMRIRF